MINCSGSYYSYSKDFFKFFCRWYGGLKQSPQKDKMEMVSYNHNVVRIELIMN